LPPSSSAPSPLLNLFITDEYSHYLSQSFVTILSPFCVLSLDLVFASIFSFTSRRRCRL
ncbi:hypothetical protein LINPERHAP1_LOCUS42335, partial [Linum perenne]